MVVSTIVAYLYVLSGWEQNYWYAWRARILSNALSTLMIVPPIILLFSPGMISKAKLEFWRSLEIGLIAAGFCLIGSRRPSNRNRGGRSVLLCAFTVAVMGSGHGSAWVGCASRSCYRVYGFLRCLRRPRSLRH